MVPNFNSIGSKVSEPQMVENHYSPLTCGIALTTVYALTCYTVMTVQCTIIMSIPLQLYSLWLQTPTRSRAAVHLIFSLFVPSSNCSLWSQELTTVSEKSTNSSTLVIVFTVVTRADHRLREINEFIHIGHRVYCVHCVTRADHRFREVNEFIHVRHRVLRRW